MSNKFIKKYGRENLIEILTYTATNPDLLNEFIPSFQKRGKLTHGEAERLLEKARNLMQQSQA